ncbi:MAG TPA: response regulator [Burkholderiales bacterium]|nr:response regulator [Burkholderiales bacterium]
MRVLIVEDDRQVRETVADYLQTQGCEVAQAGDGTAMRQALAQRLPDLVLLDVRLPGEDGLALARWLRERHELPIIMVTAAGEVIDRVVGLEVGADDYIGKPFDLRELLARIKSVLRRARAPAASPAASRRVSFGPCTLDLDRHQLIGRGGEEIPLTGMEFDLLRAFAEHPNRVLSRDQLLTLTRNREWEPFDRSIDIRIARLRRKIEADPDKPKTIKTVRGSGYIFIPKDL